MRVRKVNIIQDIAFKNFNSIQNIFFYLQKFNTSLVLLCDWILKKLFYLGELNTLIRKYSKDEDF